MDSGRNAELIVEKVADRKVEIVQHPAMAVTVHRGRAERLLPVIALLGRHGRNAGARRSDYVAGTFTTA